VRAEGQRPLARVVHHPAGGLARNRLETAAVRNQALVLLHQGNGRAQAGGRLQQKAHHIEARRAHHRPGAQAKAGVLRALRGRAPQPRDVVNGPAFGLQFLGRNARHRQHLGALHPLALRRCEHRVDPAHRDRGLQSQFDCPPKSIRSRIISRYLLGTTAKQNRAQHSARTGDTPAWHTPILPTSWSSAAAWPASSPPWRLLRQGQRVTLVDRDTPERLGGLALWAFGGMALVGTPLQARMKIPDTPERALADWLRFGELAPDDTYPQQWARYYVEHSRSQVYDWLIGEGVKFMPAVNWVERGMHGDGNSVPRYHIVWGTSRELTRRMVALRAADSGGRLTVLHRPPRIPRSSTCGRAHCGRRGGKRGHGAPKCACKPRWWCWPWAASTAATPRPGATGPGTAPCPPPCSTAPTPLPTVRCTTGPLQTPWAHRSHTRARCGTTRQAFRTRFRTSRARPLDHSLQIGAVAQPPGRAHRPRAAGDRL
jgi:hypothetical protein